MKPKNPSTYWTNGQISEYKLVDLHENIELMIYSLVAFFVPFFLGHSQLLTGTIVNAALVLAALNLKGIKLLPVVLLPSLAVLASGFIFGPASSSMYFLAPVIWLGNALLIVAIKELVLGRHVNRLLALGTGAIVKTAFLFCAGLALVSFGFVPSAVLVTLGVMQLYTALMGGVAAFGLQMAKKQIA